MQCLGNNLKQPSICYQKELIQTREISKERLLIITPSLMGISKVLSCLNQKEEMFDTRILLEQMEFIFYMNCYKYNNWTIRQDLERLETILTPSLDIRLSLIEWKNFRKMRNLKRLTKINSTFYSKENLDSLQYLILKSLLGMNDFLSVCVNVILFWIEAFSTVSEYFISGFEFIWRSDHITLFVKVKCSAFWWVWWENLKFKLVLVLDEHWISIVKKLFILDHL